MKTPEERLKSMAAYSRGLFHEDSQIGRELLRELRDAIAEAREEERALLEETQHFQQKLRNTRVDERRILIGHLRASGFQEAANAIDASIANEPSSTRTVFMYTKPPDLEKRVAELEADVKALQTCDSIDSGNTGECFARLAVLESWRSQTAMLAKEGK